MSTLFWKAFKISLKRSYFTQLGNWVKYAFMKKCEGKLFYDCEIPQKVIVPEGFIQKKINSYRYRVVEHIGISKKLRYEILKIEKSSLILMIQEVNA